MECQMALRALLLTVFLAGASGLASAAGPNGAQQKGAEQFLAAVASGNAQAIAQELHPDELEKLRTRLLELLRAENSRNDNTYRSRLFGPGRSLADLESMTAVRFYAALSDRLRSARARVSAKSAGSPPCPMARWSIYVGRGDAAKGSRLGESHRDGRADAIRRAVARGRAERNRSADRRSARRRVPRRPCRRPAARSAASPGAAAARSRPASASFWRAPKPASRTTTARSTTASS